MTKDNWIKAFCAKYLCDDGCIIGDPCRWCLSKAERIYEDFQSQISQVEKDAIEKTKQELKEFDMGRNWYFEGDELVITRGKWVIDRYKKHGREEDL